MYARFQALKHGYIAEKNTVIFGKVDKKNNSYV